MEGLGTGPGGSPRETVAPGPAALLVNVRARHGRAALALARRTLREQGLEVALSRELDDPAGIPALVEEAIAAGATRLVIGGGDGTLSAVADAARRRIALGVLPLGTGNDFARSLGLPAALPEACEVIARGAVVPVDAGRVDGRLFLNAASVGVSAAATRRLGPRMKRGLGRLSFPLAAAAESWGHRSFRVHLATDARTLELEALQVVIGNGRYHGGGRLVAPDASLGDARLDVYAILAAAPRSRPSRWRNLAALARVGAKTSTGAHVADPAVVHERTTRLRLVADPPQEIDLDGELFGPTPATFAVDPGALRVLAPGDRAGRS
jgi:YegS/Rv2252/BmrU family lipid kinase